ncbi:hypothetical protein EMPS_01199 [Entomortierella parvispora]|uniref:BZIP domain-containing protein n=1 Tax=Entomortierella parvispora TaxID=205924 RepID=A0A9P3H2E0_9FUNG|nr:hypothetical protein EMPS_01199 [Entomortierella parvispora]
MNKNNSNTGAIFAERLLKSADSLDFALSSPDKKGLSRQGLIDFGSLDTVFGSSELSATLFDDWLSNDLEQAGFSSQDDSSSDSDSNSHSPVLSSKSDSPVVGFDSISSDAELVQSPGFESTMAFFPDMPAPSRDFGSAISSSNSAPMLPLTPEAVQQAAAALNIPWSKGLEEAVLAQSLLASFPMAMPLSVRQPATPIAPATPAAGISASALANLLPKHGASINVAHESAMDTPMSPMTPTSPMSERAQSATPSLPPSTPRLSILSCTQTRLPVAGASTTVHATTYKSSYRSASLKRDREFEEPPSVLDGKDISEMDEVSLKRAKNTDAARRSRHKKLVKMESLEQRVAELEVENSMFESKLNEVELERSLLADKDQMQQARIQELEQLLSSLREKLY